MALNLKNPEVEKLAAEVARLANESKTEAIRRALQERKARLELHRRKRPRTSLEDSLRNRIWPQIPKALLGTTITKQEREDILGYGADGV